MIDLFTNSGATYSPCQKYRYTLFREWNPRQPTLTYILCNPSTATEFISDPTVTRCTYRARSWEYGRLEILNIFGLRSTLPKVLYESEDPIGPENDESIKQVCLRSDKIICGWGIHGNLGKRGKYILAMMESIGITTYALKVNADGSPCHPLYLNYDLEPYELKYKI